jgi:hypothetical protein
MIKRLLILVALSEPICAQVVNTATMDSSDYKIKGKVTFEGYVDAYYAYNFNEPAAADQPYLVSMSRHNEFNINLAFIDVKYSSTRIRARIVPGFGTYINANYAREAGSLKNLIEANAGVRITKSKNIWLDVGILGSPYTNESAISKDHLAYTRSLAAENVPYYLSGAKLTVPVSQKIIAYLYLINGWQQITDDNSNKSVGTQLEYRPNNLLLLNWNTYIGKESVLTDSTESTRYFSDIYAIYHKGPFSATSCIYYGVQKTANKEGTWWQANIIARYSVTPLLSTTIRVEYFKDSDGVLVVPVTKRDHFESYGVSVGLNLKLDDNILFRAEARQLFSDKQIFFNDGVESKNSVTLTGSVCAWF